MELCNDFVQSVFYKYCYSILHFLLTIFIYLELTLLKNISLRLYLSFAKYTFPELWKIDDQFIVRSKKKKKMFV